MKKLLLLFCLFAFFFVACNPKGDDSIPNNATFAELFPDENFRNRVNNAASGVDLNTLKGKALQEQLATIKVIDLNSRNISNLTGVEWLTALTLLWTFDNQLSSLDVSKNTALTTLSVAGQEDETGANRTITVTRDPSLTYRPSGWNTPSTSLIYSPSF